jgi:hypothetical protein
MFMFKKQVLFYLIIQCHKMYLGRRDSWPSQRDANGGAPARDQTGVQQPTTHHVHALLPGPNTGFLKILEKNSDKWEKILHFFKNVFTAMNDKIRIKMSCLEILSQKQFWWQLLTKANKWKGKFIVSIQYFFRPLLSKIGGRTAAKFSRPIILFGRFCVILKKSRPASRVVT